MNIYQKLQNARINLQSTNLKKSGQNKFAGYDYFELGDFLPEINNIMQELQMTSFINFNHELATLSIVNSENPEEIIIFTSPMSVAQLKGCHDVQNLGAVQTYLRRYLYVNAFEIVEHDALDSTTGNATETSQEIRSDKKTEKTTRTITDTEKNAIKALCERKGVSEKVVIDFYKVKDFSEMTKAVYTKAVNYLQTKQDKAVQM